MLRAVLLALVVLLTACSPTPITPPPGSPAPTTASTRPRDIDISGLLPCDLLTPAQRVELGLDGEPRSNSGNDALFGQARRCDIISLDVAPAVRFRITLAVEYGIERFSESGVIDGVEAIEIAGYPAVLSPPPPSMPDNCIVAVDIAPGQMVGILLADGGGVPAVPLDRLCRDVLRFSEAVISTLASR